jgi:hypothetical protein
VSTQTDAVMLLLLLLLSFPGIGYAFQ